MAASQILPCRTTACGPGGRKRCPKAKGGKRLAKKRRQETDSPKMTGSASARGANTPHPALVRETALSDREWRRGPNQRAARGLARLWPGQRLPPTPVQEIA